jgi:energy-coupling factor transporter ATP-binding protein EcfA2
MGSIASPLMIISKAISASASLFELIDAECQDITGLRDPEVSGHADITFANVTFSYPTRSGVLVLKGFNAVFRNGKTTALVGPSGSGKSTIVGLLERWYQLQPESEDQKEESPKGGIFVDGENLNALDLKWWRSQIGLVQQEPFLFNDTVLNNVAFGLIGSKWEKETNDVKEELVKAACKEAFADEFIQGLPEGYSTLVGEMGIKLSGGQRQRLAIARSIVKQPSILVLDEATSAIDVHGEKIVQAALTRVSRNRTTIVIAHRLSTIRDADHIIVMREGRNIEEGTHSELVAIEDGVYHGLVNAQTLEALDADVDLEDVTALEKKATTEAEGTAALADDQQQKESGAGTGKKTGIMQSLGRVLYEQQTHWLAYTLILVATMGAGSAFALQSWMSAKLVEAFQFTGQKLMDGANFWALMFLILALAMFACYSALGYTTNNLSVVSLVNPNT